MNKDQKTRPDECDPPDTAYDASRTGKVLRHGGDEVMLHGDVERVISFNEIAGGTAGVIIEYEGQKYRLRATRNGRLLLNK